MECQTSNHHVTCHFKFNVQKWSQYLPLKYRFVFPTSFGWLMIRTCSNPNSSHAVVCTIYQTVVCLYSGSPHPPLQSPSSPYFPICQKRYRTPLPWPGTQKMHLCHYWNGVQERTKLLILVKPDTESYLLSQSADRGHSETGSRQTPLSQVVLLPSFLKSVLSRLSMQTKVHTAMVLCNGPGERQHSQKSSYSPLLPTR